jgi:hypothetical protein
MHEEDDDFYKQKLEALKKQKEEETAKKIQEMESQWAAREAEEKQKLVCMVYSRIELDNNIVGRHPISFLCSFVRIPKRGGGLGCSV